MISFIILTFNSQKYLKEVLSSVSWADEVVIVDSGSSDESLEIARSFKNVRVFEHSWLGFAVQKQFGVDMARNEWVFILDSDEVMRDELKREILGVLKEPKFRAYYAPRLNYFFGRAIRHCGLYPDLTLRFFDKNMARFDGSVVHEKVVAKCETSRLKEHFLHYAYDSIEQFIAKQNRYSSLSQKKPSKIKAILSPFWTFFKIYILKLGFLEGWHGYIIARLYAQYTFWKYIK